MKQLICAHCNVGFTQKRPNYAPKYCTKECYIAAMRKAYEAIKPPIEKEQPQPTPKGTMEGIVVAVLCIAIVGIIILFNRGTLCQIFSQYL